MTIWLSYLLVFVGGYLVINYFPQLLDLGIQHLINLQTVRVNEMQKKLDKEEEGKEDLQPSIGFQYQPEMEYDDERDD